MVNPMKNEIEIDLGEDKLMLSPTLGAILEIEQQTGKSILEIVRSVENQEIKLRETLAVIKAASKAAGKMLLEEEILDLVNKYGAVHMHTCLADFYLIVLYGGEAYRELQAKKSEAANGKAKGKSRTK